jgi:phenylalanyl-tRNA synthetase alpha chain
VISRLEELRAEALAALGAAGDGPALQEVKARYLGRRGAVSGILQSLGSLPPAERARVGQVANRVKDELEAAATARAREIERAREDAELAGPGVDPTLPGRRTRFGHRHPITQVLREVEQTFVEMGFEIADGPEVELDYYNFEALNIPRDHPARDMQDTFYLSDDVVLRTHTSPVQIRYMEKHTPPLRIICPGKVYRCDYDATHSPMFFQVEGLMVDEQVSFADLKGVLEVFAKRLFGPGQEVQLRPSYFPFVEPGADLHGRCFVCGGSQPTCRVCKGTGWLELLGAGMVHPEVFRFAGYEPYRYTGFAFGMGIDRIAMLKYGIGDIRLLFENDMRFLGQF